jgi:transcription initiation factor TFIID subunit 9B
LVCEGYVSEVFQDALLFSEHANKQTVDISDIQLAIQSRLAHSFTQPPTREVDIVQRERERERERERMKEKERERESK